jgi:hypothetical protein
MAYYSSYKKFHLLVGIGAHARHTTISVDFYLVDFYLVDSLAIENHQGKHFSSSVSPVHERADAQKEFWEPHHDSVNSTYQ